MLVGAELYQAERVLYFRDAREGLSKDMGLTFVLGGRHAVLHRKRESSGTVCVCVSVCVGGVRAHT